MLLVTIALGLLIVYVFYKVKLSKRDAAWATFPKPKSVFLFHHSLELSGIKSDDIIEKFQKWHDELGEVFMFSKHPFDCGTVMVSDPDIAEIVSFHQPDRTRSMAFAFLSQWIGNDTIFLGSGNRLKQKLQIGLKMLKAEYSPRYYKTMNEQVNIFMNVADESDGSIDIFHMANNFAIDLVYKAQFGIELNTMTGKHSEYVEALDQINDIVYEAYVSPLPKIAFIQSFTQQHKKATKVLEVLEKFSTKAVEHRRKNHKLPHEDGHETIDSFFQIKVDGELLTDQQIRDEVNSIILGNHDTIKTTITFLMYHLAKHQNVQDKVYREAKEVMKDDLSREIDEADLEQMHYLEAVIKETLRLFPPVPFIGRKLKSEKVVGDYVFPKDVEVLISPYLMMRNPKYFDDPLTFDPDRFLGIKTMPKAFSAFSIGARKCIGGKYAISALKMISMKILLQNRMKLAEGQNELVICADMVLKPKEKIWITLERRL